MINNTHSQILKERRKEREEIQYRQSVRTWTQGQNITFNTCGQPTLLEESISEKEKNTDKTACFKFIPHIFRLIVLKIQVLKMRQNETLLEILGAGNEGE